MKLSFKLASPELRSYSRANTIIAKVSVGALFCFIIIGILGGIFYWYSDYDFVTTTDQ